MEIHAEAVEAKAGDDLPVVTDMDLVLDIDGRGFRRALVVGVTGALPEMHGQCRNRIADRHKHAGLRAADGAEVAGFTEIGGVLPAQFRAGYEAMGDIATDDVDDIIGLVEDIGAVGPVVVRRNRDDGAAGIDSARIDVLVELAVIGDARPVAQHGAVHVVFNQDIEGGGIGIGGAVFGVSEKKAAGGVQRFPEIGWNAAVDRPGILEQFSAEHDAGIGIDAEGHARCEPAQAAADAVAETAGVFGHGVDPVSHVITPRIADIGLAAEEVGAAGLDGKCAVATAIGLFADAVDDAAGAAASENHRIRPFQNLDLADVVKVAEILDVIADAIRIEISGAGIAAHHRRITVAFALCHADAGHITQDVRHAMQGLVVDLLFGHDGDRLRGVLQRRFGFHGAARVAGLIAEGKAFDFDFIQYRRIFRCGHGGGSE